MFCTNCGKEIADDSKVCGFCGMVIDGALDTDTDGKKIALGNTMMKCLKILAILLVVAAVGAVGFRAYKIINKDDDKKAEFTGVYYLKDNNLMFSKFPGKESVKIDDDIIDDWSDSTQYYTAQLRLSQDGKYVYYGTEIKSMDYSFNLYRIKTSGKEEPEKISSDVTSYSFCGGDDLLLKDSDSSLYLYDGKERTRIARDVSQYCVDESYNYVLWLDNDNDMYYQPLNLKKDKEKLDKDVISITDWSDKLKSILYVKANDEGTDIYRIQGFGEKEKLVSGAEEYSASLEKDTPIIYYTRSEDSDISLMDLIDDDYIEDGSITQPNMDDYTTYETVDSFWGTTQREIVDDKYYDELEKYNDKVDRDKQRTRLENQSLGMNEIEIFFCDGDGDDEKIASGIVEIESISSTDNGHFLIYSEYDLDQIKKIKLSQLLENPDRETELEDLFYDIRQVKIAKGSQIADMDFGESKVTSLSAYTGKDVMYVLDYESEDDDTGILYSVDLNSSNFGMLRKISDDAAGVGILENKVYYVSDIDPKKNEGALYCGSDRIDNDVYIYRNNQNADAGYLYFKDYDSGDAEGTLYLYKGGSPIKIKSDVHSYYAYNDKYIAILTDYSLKSHMGDLRLFDGKESIKIASDVNTIIYY